MGYMVETSWSNAQPAQMALFNAVTALLHPLGRQSSWPYVNLLCTGRKDWIVIVNNHTAFLSRCVNNKVQELPNNAGKTTMRLTCSCSLEKDSIFLCCYRFCIDLLGESIYLMEKANITCLDPGPCRNVSIPFILHPCLGYGKSLCLCRSEVSSTTSFSGWEACS